MIPSGRELAMIAAALLLPIPLLAASGLMVPLPSAVERALVSLLPSGEIETGPGGGLPVSTSPRSSTAGERASGPGREQDSAEVLSEGGTATVHAGNSAAGSDDSAADNVLPGDERLLPGGREADLPAAPGSPAPEVGSEAGADNPGADNDITAPVTVSQSGVEVDTAATVGSAGVSVGVSQQNGITLTADADRKDTSGDVTVTLPAPTIPLP